MEDAKVAAAATATDDNKQRVKCGVCFNTYAQESHFFRHFRKAHKEFCNKNYGCPGHGEFKNVCVFLS